MVSIRLYSQNKPDYIDRPSFYNCGNVQPERRIYRQNPNGRIKNSCSSFNLFYRDVFIEFLDE